MKLKLLSADFETGEITFLVPMDVFKGFEFVPCDLEVDVEPLKRKITSNNSQYAKFPSFEDVYNHTGEVFEDDCRRVYDVIKKLGNFA